MLYRRFGKTELNLPVFTFGAMRSMLTWDNKSPSNLPEKAQNKLHSILEKALSLGVNHIETAHGYGSSEYQLGLILPRFNRDDYILQTKVGPEDNPAVFTANVEKSLALLQTDHIELLAIHGINDHKSLWQSVRPGGCLHEARKLQKQGLIGHIGFSGHGPCEVICEAIQHKADGGFDYVNLHWYYILDVNRTAIELARKKDMGVYIISPTDKGGRLFDPPPVMIKICAPLSPMVFNDLYCLSKDGVHSIGIGAAVPSDFDEHLKTISYLQQNSTQKLLQEIDIKLQQKMQKETGHFRPDQHWNKFPCWQETPGNINLPMAIWLSNLEKGWDLSQFAKERYSKLGTATQWVPGNNCAYPEIRNFSSLCKELNTNEENFKQYLSNIHTQLSEK